MSMTADRVETLRAADHPLFNDQKLKLGLFSFNTSNAMMATSAPTSYELSWTHTKSIAQAADAMGMEVLVPVARWRGFGGDIDFAGESYETYTWAAAIAEATENIVVCSTSHVPTVSPVAAAKQAVTIDHIANGRFGLNVVMGWFRPEMEMFGGEQREHDIRYQFGDEWLSIVKRLWTEDEPFDVKGEYFNLKDVQGKPKPIQKPYPVLINAGSSAAGLDFSAKHVDINFIGMGSFEMGAEAVKAVRSKAAEYGRDISTMTYASIVCRDTEAEAKRDYQRLVDGIDWKSIDYLTKVFGLEGQSYGDAEQVRQLRTQFALGWGGMTFVGTPEQVAEQFLKTSEAGLDGIVVGFLDYLPELGHFNENIMPLLKEAGLRH
ncbi:LLM class flavin-dependent oxidoreductase [Nocardioides immobilis]|uniref:LLM class flavin-dependent oxidoreductase n=1 Tax=Nocardioides immobilis TaxID=2049295 RepID=A0A417Y7F9_9ACTN|nr:LLM class flavin-dependent oxidoreductase [Nocardioides immobilis]RHW28394.1 LLM class flavin-dependent oxidoreductase [Nocardioides immobilis]